MKPKSRRNRRSPVDITVGIGSVVGRDEARANRRGAHVIGLYPEVSRTKLAERTGRHISSITSILKGRTKCTLDLAVKIADAIGIPVERLNKDLLDAQIEFAASRLESARARR